MGSLVISQALAGAAMPPTKEAAKDPNEFEQRLHEIAVHLFSHVGF